MLVDFGKAGWIEKARQQPEKVRLVVEKCKTDGILPTLEAVLSKLDKPLPLGYCNVGTVLATGSDIIGYSHGDRVVSNGKHAQAVSVPLNLTCRVPANVSDDEAVFTVLASIALQGVRLAQPTLGECFVVTGLGIVGLLTVQILRANGCRVLGIDFDPNKLELARSFGAEVVDLSTGEDPVAVATRFSRDRGVDGVLIAASTSSNEPIRQSAHMCRKRGRIVLVGVAGLEFSRADFYEKELSFQVSCSYGPGRYDASYEEDGNDYPIGFVRWTEQRNFEAVLDMMSDGRLSVLPFISHRFSIDAAEEAYDLITGDSPSLGVLLEYPAPSAIDDQKILSSTVVLQPMDKGSTKSDGCPSITFIGSGNYASAVLIPAFKATGARIHSIVSSEGISSAEAARKHGATIASTDTSNQMQDQSVEAIVISTRHDTHAALICSALSHNKHVFVEKPFAITEDELHRISDGYSKCIARGFLPIVMIGFNRRFSPLTRTMKKLLAEVSGPKTFIATVNAGAIPADHWTQDPNIGGGRIIGEACHFIDLIQFLCGSPIESVRTNFMESPCGDTASIELAFRDGSIGTVHYLANGSKSFPKERIEAFAGGRVLQLDNFRRLHGFGWPKFRHMRLWRQDKGQRACCSAFVNAVHNRLQSPVDFDEIINVSLQTIRVATQTTSQAS